MQTSNDVGPTATAAPQASRKEQKNKAAAPVESKTSAKDREKSSAALGKRMFDMKVDYAVRQIHELLPAK